MESDGKRSLGFSSSPWALSTSFHGICSEDAYHSLWLHSSRVTQFHFCGFPQKSWPIHTRCLGGQHISLKIEPTVNNVPSHPRDHRFQHQTDSLALKESPGYFYSLRFLLCLLVLCLPLFLLCSPSPTILVYFLCWAIDSVSSNPYLPRSHLPLMLHINSLIYSIRIK